MKKILLLNPPGDKLYSRDKYCTSISKANYYWTPLDLLVFSGHLKNDFELKVLDAIAERIDAAKASSVIAEFKPYAIISLTSSASWKEDFDFLKVQKSSTGAKIILSGGFLLSQGILAMKENEFIDACILDFTTGDIIKFLNNSEPFNNIIYRKGLEIIETPRTAEKEFSYPVPAHELFPIKKYRYPISLYGSTSCVIASFGCPFKCSFCVPATLNYKLRNVNNVIEELKYISKLKIREVVFQDSTFTANRDHAYRICEEMLKNNLKLPWICLTRVDCVDRELLNIMKKAHCHSIEFGVESSDENILRSISKNITIEKIKEAFRLSGEIGIRSCAFFILGLPGQDESAINKTADFAVSLKPDVVSFSLVMPHPGTPMGEEMLPGRTDILQYDDASEPKVSMGMPDKNRLISLRNKAYRKFYLRPSYITKRIFALRSFFQLKLEFSEFISLIKNYLIGNR